MISLVLGILNALSAHSPIASAEAAAPSVDVSGVLDLEQSPEEKMVGSDLPPTPESGSENPEDLLKSAPAIEQAHRPTKSASAKGDGLPASLPPIKGAKPAPHAPPVRAPLPAVEDTSVSEAPPAEELPPTAPPASMESVDVPAEPKPELAATGESPGESGTTTKKWDRSIPIYDRENPHWGIDIHGSMEALGSSITADLATGTTETHVRNFGLGFEYEPEFLQSIGVVSIGPSLNLYVMDPAGDITNSAFSVYSLGASVKYQLKFMRGQWFVPFVGYEVQQIRYSFAAPYDPGTGWTTSSGPVFGGLLLLNWMEPSAAYNLYADSGIRRSYLVGEVKNLQASGVEALSSDGIAIYFGLRLEY